jgi:quercetin dioxygenase-like cupin family protein
MPYIDLNEITPRELVPGYHARFVHTDNMTMAFWKVDAGAVLSEHKHPHEQITTVLEGEFELTVAGEKYLCKPGSAVVIPGNVPHNAVALTACQILDAFYPPRSEYR